MASQKQITANRQNAKLSTGPRTPPGKKRSSRNALKTGIFSKLLLLPDEDGAELSRLRLAFYEEWRPLGPTERNFLERLIAQLWRQQRVYWAESGLFTMYRRCPEGVGGVAVALAKDGQETEAFTRLSRTDSQIERSIITIIQMLQKLQKQRGQRRGLKEEPDVP